MQGCFLENKAICYTALLLPLTICGEYDHPRPQGSVILLLREHWNGVGGHDSNWTKWFGP